MGIKAIITAGGPPPRSMADRVSVSRKALIEVNGRSLLQTAIEAARDCHLIEDFVVVGNADVERSLGGHVPFLTEGGSLVENTQRGFNHFGGESEDYLTISPDLPFLTGATLTAFLEAAPKVCDIGVPLVSRDDFLRSYPGAPNKFTRLFDGREVTTGSCFYLTGPALKANFPLFHDFYSYRKQPHRLAILLGFRILWAFLFGGLTVELSEERTSQLTGVNVKAVESTDAAIAYDIDTLENYEFALQVRN